jgi:molecular chaperone DnaK (HSP70)
MMQIQFSLRFMCSSLLFCCCLHLTAVQLQRYMGEGALSISRSNFKNTVTSMKRLIGRKWGEPELQADLQSLCYETQEHPEVRHFHM